MSRGNVLRKFIPHTQGITNCLMRYKMRLLISQKLSTTEIVNFEYGKTSPKEMIQKLQGKYYEKVKILSGEFAKLAKLTGTVENEIILADALFCYFAYGFEIDEYFGFNLQDKGFEERKKFFSNRDMQLMAQALNDIFDREKVSYKDVTYDFFKKYFKREALCAREISAEKFDDFLTKHHAAVLKDPLGSNGKDVTLVRRSDITDVFSYFEDNLKGKNIFIEQPIIQSSEMSYLNSSSINTVRMVCMRTKNDICIPFSVVRMGRKGSFVDNASSGGVFAGVDPKTGVIFTDVLDQLGQCYECHPDTEIKLKGIKLPEWFELLDLAKEVSGLLPSVRYISWDFAHTQAGWIVLEANEMGRTRMFQIANGKGFKRQMMKIIEATDAPLKSLVLKCLS